MKIETAGRLELAARKEIDWAEVDYIRINTIERNTKNKAWNKLAPTFGMMFDGWDEDGRPCFTVEDVSKVDSKAFKQAIKKAAGKKVEIGLDLRDGNTTIAKKGKKYKGIVKELKKHPERFEKVPGKNNGMYWRKKTTASEEAGRKKPKGEWDNRKHKRAFRKSGVDDKHYEAYMLGLDHAVMKGEKNNQYPAGKRHDNYESGFNEGINWPDREKKNYRYDGSKDAAMDRAFKKKSLKERKKNQKGK